VDTLIALAALNLARKRLHRHETQVRSNEWSGFL
jgi:hypothetical protein